MGTEQTEFQELVGRISDLKYVHVNDEVISIESSFINDLDWLLEIVHFTKSFVGFTRNLHESPIHITENETYAIVEEPPFLHYKEDIKLRYQKIMSLMKGVYRNALKLPNVEKIYYTLEKEFNVWSYGLNNHMNQHDAICMERDTQGHHTTHLDINVCDNVQLKNPETIFEHFVYNVNSYTHIQEKHSAAIQCIKVFEYLYYKLLNHIKELEFDADSMKPVA